SPSCIPPDPTPRWTPCCGTCSWAASPAPASRRPSSADFLSAEFHRRALVPGALMMRRLSMAYRVLFPVFVLTLAIHGVARAEPGSDNPAIDMAGYLGVSMAAATHRETRRVSEAEFIRMSREPGTVVLDARSRQKFDELHVKGAINLSFPD